jgi:hypothetical protein
MNTGKTLLMLAFTCMTISLVAQDTAQTTSSTLSLREKADFAAHEIEKLCGIDDKLEFSNLGKACYEYELAMSMEGVVGNESKEEAIEKEWDKAVKSIVGPQKMAAFTDWKQKPKAYEQKGDR